MKHTIACFALAVSGAVAVADDWPQWQGPDRNAVSKEKGLLKEWPKDGPTLAWQTKELGGGDSTPSIAGGKIYGMSNRGDDEVVWALSEKDGKELWKIRLGAAFQQRVPQSKEGPGCTPTVDGDRLFVLGVGGDLACLEAKDGKEVWRVNFGKDFGGVPPMWNYRESPLIDGDKLICTPGGPDATIVALNKKDGKTLWKCKVPKPDAGNAPAPGGGGGRMGRGPQGGAAYSSPIVIEFNKLRQYVQFTSNSLVGVGADNGKLLWRYDKPANGMGINCTTPLHHDGKIFAASAYGAGGGLVQLSKDGDTGIKAEEVFFSKQMQNHHGGVIRVENALYGANGGNGGGFLVCMDERTGKVLWDARDADEKEKRIEKGSIAQADDRLYYRTESGLVLLIEPNAKEYTERGRFQQPERRKVPAWAHPVIANGKLYIRDQDLLFCYDVKAK